MRYPQELIEEIISKTNIVDVIGREVTLKRTGNRYTGLCPFHSEKTGSFSVSATKQLYYCFGCHASGNVITFMMEYHRMTFTEAVEALAEAACVALPERSNETPGSKRMREKRELLYEINKKAANFYYSQLKGKKGEQGLAYFKKRGLSDKTVFDFGLGYADRFGSSLYSFLKKDGYSDELLSSSGLFLFDEKKGVSDKFWNRVMFPIQDARSKVIGFGGRVMGDGKPKYLNSPDTELFNKRLNLYALNKAKNSHDKAFLLCEGYVDVISLHQAGFGNAVASLGTALTPEQVSLMKRYKKEILLLYDSDNAGRAAALRAIELIKDAGMESRVVDLSPYKDPDEFINGAGREAFEKRLLEAENSFIFSIEQLGKGFDLSDPSETTAFEKEIARKLLMFSEDIERENYLSALCRKYGFPAGMMRTLVRNTAMTGTGNPVGPKDKERTAPDRSSGISSSDTMLLAVIARFDDAFGEIEDILSPGDFEGDICRRVAEELFRQKKDKSFSPSHFISSFDDPELIGYASAVMQMEIPVNSDASLSETFRELAVRILERSIRKGNDISLDEIVTKKSLIENIKTGKRALFLSYEKEE